MLQVILIAFLSGGALLAVRLPAGADTANVPSLVISQLKITSSNGQFITLYNATDAPLDMSQYQLQYFNSYDLGKATSSKLIALSGTVPPHGYYMVSDGSLLLCYQLTVESVSLGLSSTAGLIEVLAFNQASPGGSVTPVLQDYVGWSKTAASGAQTLPAAANAFLGRQPVDEQNNPVIEAPGAGGWRTLQPDPANACSLVTAGPDGPVTIPAAGSGQLLPASEPPAIIASLDGESAAPGAPTPVLPAADIGLMTPTITELLPNPNGTGNDASDEFIELYNPNGVSFDLTGFILQAGATTLRSYSFPKGTTLSAKSFTSFASSVTGLSLSNSGGQAKLLDPFGNSISVSEPYGTAKDGQTWALANGKWYWTTSPTPGKANVINQPKTTKTAKAATAKPKSGTAATAKKLKTAKTGAATSGSAFPGDDSSLPIHPRTLALVAGLALLYGAYEYRADLANRFYQLRSHLSRGRGGRP